MVEFHNALHSCVIEYLQKDPRLVRDAINGLLRYWPAISCNKCLMFLQELEELFNNHPAICKPLIPKIMEKLAECVASPYYEIVERALQVRQTSAFGNVVM